MLLSVKQYWCAALSKAVLVWCAAGPLAAAADAGNAWRHTLLYYCFTALLLLCCCVTAASLEVFAARRCTALLLCYCFTTALLLYFCFTAALPEVFAARRCRGLRQRRVCVIRRVRAVHTCKSPSAYVSIRQHTSAYVRRGECAPYGVFANTIDSFFSKKKKSCV